ncbi:MAG TPA: hypothetical protein VER96_14725 [Polyangiaceae bacterium]|nr:hypothetical protein [Polyangiaceae bacterium]
MTSLNEAIERRTAGHLRIAAVRVQRNDNLSATLSRLGLDYQGEPCREVDGMEARRMLTALFARDLAYKIALMPQADAERFADFVSQEVFPRNAKLLTNVDEFDEYFCLEEKAYRAEPFVGSYASFFIGTKATFSAGIIAVGEHVVACVWVEDED